MNGLRVALVALLLATTALFAAGVIAERSHTEPLNVHAQESGEVAGADADQASSDERERLLGVDIESAPLIALAVIAGLALTVLAAAPWGRRRVRPRPTAAAPPRPTRSWCPRRR